MVVVKYNSLSGFEIISIVLMLFGVVIGTFISLYNINIDLFDKMFTVNYSSESIFAFKYFLKWFLYFSLILIIIFVCGLSSVLQPIILSVGLVVGYGYGYCISQIYMSDYKNQVLIGVLSFVIPAVITSFSVMIAQREAFNLSVNVAKALFSSKNFIGFSEAIKIYIVKFWVLEAFLAVGAFLRCLTIAFYKNLGV